MKLQERTIRSFIFYALAIALVSVPLFYFVIQRISSRSIDEGLLLQKEDLVRRLNRSILEDPFRWLEDFEPDVHVQPVQEFRQLDTLYTALFVDRSSGRRIHYRVLESIVLINGVPYSIQLKNSLLSKEDLIKTIVWAQAILTLLFAAGMFWINRNVENKSWKPFYAILDKLKRYKIESGEKIPFEPTDIDEFQDLHRAIASLTSRNQQAYFAQKEFTENASHEMQSPLAVIQGKTELLMQTSPLTEEQAELISDLSAAAQRMNRLNRSLLLLSKIENRQFHEQEFVDMTELLSRTIRQYANALDQKHIQTSLNLSQQPVILSGNRSLLETLTGNLVSNAIRHNREDGSLLIDLDADSLRIGNSGKSAALEEGKLFRRFQRQSSDPSSTGLGLEIIRKICDLYGFKIEYHYENELHYFTVRFHP